MKIALAQLNYHIGNFEGNVTRIKDAIAKAKQQQADIVVFAELAICGYPPRDFLEFGDFTERCYAAMEDIALECKDIAAIVGGPSVNPRIEGKNLYNSAFFLSDGKITATRNKALLPNYDVFDEYRYFEHGREFKVIEYKGKRIALTVCEDLWDIEEDLMYTICPMDMLSAQKPDLMINIAASPFSYNHAAARRKVLSTNAMRYGLPLFYVNHVGAQTELVFDGGSMVVNSRGIVVDEMNYFEEDFKLYELDGKDVHTEHPTGISKPLSEIALIHDALVLGIRDYFSKLGFKQAILGLSGGIDSAIVAVLAARALGNENVRCVLMPSKFSSDHSVSDAELLAKNLGSPYDIIAIGDAVQSYENILAPYFKGLPFNVAEENLQARARGMLLMALSNKFGYILLNTTNKSEAAVGYGTLYGDMCGGLAVLGDVYKTQIYALARYINSEKEIIPKNTIVKPPSAELRPDQKDSDSLPEYDILDKVLFEYIEKRKGPRELVEMGFDEQLVKRVLKLVNTNEYKRAQAPPILRVSPKAFGQGRRMPIVGKYLS
jgi:NAD+ synthase (glutamine-hydrolysing)